MGSSSSQFQLKNLQINEKAIEVNEFYILQFGETTPGSNDNNNENKSTNKKSSIVGKPPLAKKIGIFSGSAVNAIFMIDKQTPLQRAIQALKIYR